MTTLVRGFVTPGGRPRLAALHSPIDLRQRPFLDLQRQLSEAEQRIALARSYFNEIATFYNTRLEVLPDRVGARLGRLQPQALMAAADFERAPVHVAFAG